LTRRRRAIWFIATLVSGILLCAGLAVVRARLLPRLTQRLEAATGHRISIGGLGVAGLQTLVLRDVRVFGAPPFEGESLARIERMNVRLGGPGRGILEPSEVSLDGVEVEFLSTGSADNWRGRQVTTPSAQSSSASVPARAHLAVSVRNARVHGTVALPQGRRLGFRIADLSFDRDAYGQETTSARGVVADAGRFATIRLPSLSVTTHRGTPVAAQGDNASVTVPGGGVVADGLALRVLFTGQGVSFDLAGEGASSRLKLACRLAGDLGDLDLQVVRLPLRALAPVLDPHGVGLDRAVATLHLMASLAGEPPRVPYQLDLDLRDFDVHHGAIDRSPWRGLNAELHSSGVVDLAGGRVEIESAELRGLGATLHSKGWVDYSHEPRGEIRVHTPEPLPCSNLLAAQPEPVQKVLAGMVLDGTLGLSLDVGFDAADWETLTLDLRLDPLCRVKTEPTALSALATALVKGQASGAPAIQLPLGKYHPEFASLSEMPAHLPGAFLTSEDGRFFSHNGFDIEMIRRALVQDLQAHAFSRGASTISQQLAKNLFLTPHRTLARKLEETVLTWRLQNLLGKDRTLELYLNVIELGPGIRGVKEAARVYFGKSLGELRPLESAHLAALTPNPHVLARRFRDGHVDEGWLQRLYDLLGMMKRSGRLTPADLATARVSKLSLRRPGKDVPSRSDL
jgi:hypothetical protein